MREPAPEAGLRFNGRYCSVVFMHRWLLFVCAFFVTGALAQSPTAARFEGTLLLINGSAEAQIANDEAQVNFYVEVQDADVARAQSLVNQRAADGVTALKRADAKAVVETAGYSSYPVYEPKTQKIIGWRVRQSVNLRTAELANLSKTVMAAQPYLALSGIDWRVSRAARERVEGELIQRAIANLNTRVAAAAQALHVPPERQRFEELNFGVPTGVRPPIPAMARMAAPSAEAMSEPQFDAGQSTQQITVSAKVRFLP